MDYKSPTISMQILLELVLVIKYKWKQCLHYVPRTDNEICCLCHELMEDDAVLITPCDHRFHDICALDSIITHKWMKCLQCSKPYDHVSKILTDYTSIQNTATNNVPTTMQLLTYHNNAPDSGSDSDDYEFNRFPDHTQIEALENANHFSDHDDRYDGRCANDLDPLRVLRKHV